MFNEVTIGNSRLIHGDCLDKMKDIANESIDMVMCDLPYGTTNCAWDTVVPFKPMWEQLKRIVKPKGAIVFTASQPFTTMLISSNMEMFKYCWVWDKKFGSNFASSNKMPLKTHEDICVFYKASPTYNKQMTKRAKDIDATNWVNDKKLSSVNLKSLKDQTATSKVYTHKNPVTVIEFSSVRGECNNTKRVHPSQKPVELMDYFIKTYTNEGETVLDFCFGSGTTGVAALNIGRKFIGIEQDETYFNIGQKRIKNLTVTHY